MVRQARAASAHGPWTAWRSPGSTPGRLSAAATCGLSNTRSPVFRVSEWVASITSTASVAAWTNFPPARSSPQSTPRCRAGQIRKGAGPPFCRDRHLLRGTRHHRLRFAPRRPESLGTEPSPKLCGRLRRPTLARHAPGGLWTLARSLLPTREPCFVQRPTHSGDKSPYFSMDHPPVHPRMADGRWPLANGGVQPQRRL